jgi:hypothetical protein
MKGKAAEMCRVRPLGTPARLVGCIRLWLCIGFSFWLPADDPERPEIGAKHPRGGTCFFRLTWVLISERVGLARERLFPGFDRHHGPPLAGFAVSGLVSPRIENARHEHRVARGVSVESGFDSCRAKSSPRPHGRFQRRSQTPRRRRAGSAFSDSQSRAAPLVECRDGVPAIRPFQAPKIRKHISSTSDSDLYAGSIDLQGEDCNLSFRQASPFKVLEFKVICWLHP